MNATSSAAAAPPCGAIELIVGPMFSGKSTELLRRLRRHKVARRSTLLVKYAVCQQCTHHHLHSAGICTLCASWTVCCAQRDTRYSTRCVATHDGILETSVSVSQLSDLRDQWTSVDVRTHPQCAVKAPRTHTRTHASPLPHCLTQVIAIDEGQFMDDLVHFAVAAADAGKLVLVAALDATFAKQVCLVHAPHPPLSRTGPFSTPAQAFGQVCSLVPHADRVDKLTAVCGVCGKDAAFTRRLCDSQVVELVGGAESYIPVCRVCHGVPRDRLAIALHASNATCSEDSLCPPVHSTEPCDASKPDTPTSLHGSWSVSPPSPLQKLLRRGDTLWDALKATPPRRGMSEGHVKHAAHSATHMHS